MVLCLFLSFFLSSSGKSGAKKRVLYVEYDSSWTWNRLTVGIAYEQYSNVLPPRERETERERERDREGGGKDGISSHLLF